MNNDIYDILNHVNTNLNEYEEINLSVLEHEINTKRIISKINGDKANKRKTYKMLKKMAVAGMIIALGMASATTISFASEGKHFSYLYKFFNGSGIINEYDEQTGVGNTTIEMNATSNVPVKLVEGKLYFIVNGDEIDITSQISKNSPFISEYVDEQNVVHKFIIGGEPIDERYGYEENLFDNNGKFIGASGFYGSEVVGVGSDNEPEWLVVGRNKVGRSE